MLPATSARFLARWALCSSLLLTVLGCGESSKKERATPEKKDQNKGETGAEEMPATPSEPPDTKASPSESAEDVPMAMPELDASVAAAKTVTPPDASTAAKEPKDPPELIELWFKSAPAGATVHRVTNGKAIFMGFTPFRLELEKRDATEDFEFRKKGYEVGASSYRMTKAGTVHVALEAVGRSAPAPVGTHDAGSGKAPK